MRELSVAELDVVAGGGFLSNLFGGSTTSRAQTPGVGQTSSGFLDSVLGGIAGAAIGANSGMIIGGMHGGDGGGVLGIGSIGQAVGLIVPTIMGAINGGILGAIYGFSNGQPWINQLIQGTANGTIGQGPNAAAVRI